MDIRTKRIYDNPANSDGHRILVDRIWPRGVKKEDARLDEWIKEIAPSNELRKWYNHKVERFDMFSDKYQKELVKQPEIIKKLIKFAEEKRLTLLYGAKDEEHNQAVVLKSYIENHQ